jgi:hypothetical protein
VRATQAVIRNCKPTATTLKTKSYRWHHTGRWNSHTGIGLAVGRVDVKVQVVLRVVPASTRGILTLCKPRHRKAATDPSSWLRARFRCLLYGKNQINITKGTICNSKRL